MPHSIPTTNRRPVRRVEARDLGDPAAFYAAFGSEPLIVTGAFPADHPLTGLTWDGVEEVMGNTVLATYEPSSPDYVHVPAPEVFRAAREGRPGPNVVDHSVVGTPLGALFDPPAFLADNWFLHLGSDAARMEKSLVLSPPGAFTSIHVDSYGMQGWMYLVEGEKHWELFRPGDAPLLYDATLWEFFDPTRHDPQRFPWLGATEAYEGTLRAGELLWFPGGWPHQVETRVPSFGVGGSVLSPQLIEGSVASWLWDRAQDLHGSLDLQAFLEGRAPDLAETDEVRAAVARALARCHEWEARRALLTFHRDLSPGTPG